MIPVSKFFFFVFVFHSLVRTDDEVRGGEKERERVEEHEKG